MVCKYCKSAIVEDVNFSGENIIPFGSLLPCDCLESKSAEIKARSDLAEKTKAYLNGISEKRTIAPLSVSRDASHTLS